MENVKTSLKYFIKIFCKFSQEIQCHNVIDELNFGLNSLNNIYSLLRKLCKRYNKYFPILLGGEGYLLNAAESLFKHKYKYNIARATNREIRVVGIVDTSYILARGFTIIVEGRSKSTLLPIPIKHV